MKQNMASGWLFCPSGLPSQVLLEFPWSLQPGGGAPVPESGVVLSEGSAGSPEERRQSDVAARLRPLVLLLPGEPQVRQHLLSDRLTY